MALDGHEPALGKNREAHDRARKALRAEGLGGEPPQEGQLRRGERAVHLALERTPDAHELLARGQELRGVLRAHAAAADQRAAQLKLLGLAGAGVVRAAQIDELELQGAAAAEFIDLKVEGGVHALADGQAAFRGGDGEEDAVEARVALLEPELEMLVLSYALHGLQPRTAQAEDGAVVARAVFCLRGATLESVQGVGQNRHLKLKLQKSRVNFDGIFFSVTADECGVCAGMRVDAAFYLQVNEFRSQRSIQLQLIDLRPSLDPSGRENEALSLCRELISGGTLSPRDAARALPSRDQFVRAWRVLEREVGPDGVSEPMLPLLRHLSSEMVGAETFLRTAMCLQVFAERGLLSIERKDTTLTLRLTADGKKVELNKSPYLSALHGFLS